MRRKALLGALAVGAASTLLLPEISQAEVAAGFGANGRHTLASADSLVVTARPSGTILAVGVGPFSEKWFSVTELRPDGTPVSGFGSGGTAQITVPGADGTADDVARIFEPHGLSTTADGGLVVQFNTSIGSALAKVSAAGALDASFGAGGYLTDQFVLCGLPTDLVVSPVDGAVTTIAHDFGTDKAGCKGTGMRRYTAAGAKVHGWGGSQFEGGRIDGRLVGAAAATDAAGNVYVSGVSFDNEAAVVKVTPTGADAAGFGTDGMASFDPVPGTPYETWGFEGGFPRTFGNKTAADIALDSEGRVLLVGSSRPAGGGNVGVWVARLTPAGALDPTFGTGGVARFDVAGGRDDYGLKLVIDGQDRPVVTGATRGSGEVRAQFSQRLTVAGQKDGGATVTTYGTPLAHVPDSAALIGDRLFVGGSYVEPIGDWGIYRGYVGAVDLGGSPPPPPPPATPSPFTGITPHRVMDTRTGPHQGLFEAGLPRTVKVTGAGGVPATGVAAVAVNVTSVGSTTGGHITMWPAGTPRPTASVLNFGPGQTVANAAIVGVGPSGEITLELSAGTGDVVVDVMGWVAEGSGFAGIEPVRAVDTRLPERKALAPGEVLDVAVTGLPGVPAGTKAVAVNLTVTEPGVLGHLRAWPAGADVPYASVLNFAGGQTVANAMVLGVGDGGAISVANYSGSTVHVVVDVMGRIDGTAAFTPIVPTRAMDTRDGLGGASFTGTDRFLKVTGQGGVPETGVQGVVVNLTVTNPTAVGHLTAWPAGGTAPTASVLNYTPAATVANAVVLGVDSEGRIALKNVNGQSDVIVDVLGWF